MSGKRSQSTKIASDMEENLIDILEILKSYPKGTKLYSPICGECKLDCLYCRGDVITVVYKGKDKSNYTASEIYDELDRNYILCFDRYGRYKTADKSDTNGEVMLFPSKENRDWNAMKVTTGFKKGDFIYNRNFICIYNGINCNGALLSFAFIPWDWDKNTSKGRYDVCPTEKPKIGIGYVNTETRFATDNEKNLLLSAIEYNGYEWDAEKLELRKKEPELKMIAEEASDKSLDESEYLARLQEFYQDNCKACGSQHCTGVYDEDWREGCKLYKKEFCGDMEINHAEPKCKTNTEAVLENKNVSPLLYGSIDSKQREIFLKRLEELYNNLGIDTEFNTPDYLLAEYTLNCLVSYGNTVAKNIEKGYIKPTLL